MIPGVLVFRVEASLLYFNVEHVRNRIWATVATNDSLRLVVCDLSNSPYVDVSGAAMLAALHKELAQRGIQLRIVEAHAKPRDLLRAEGLEEQVGYFGRHMSIDQAIAEFVEIRTTRARNQTMSKRIGVVTGGGDCPGLNAVIRSVAKAAARRGWETIGIIGGYDGLLPPGNIRALDYHALDGLLIRGGTILGTANRGQFTAKVGHGEDRCLPAELLENVKRGMDQLGLSALVTIGGDGSLSIAEQFHEYGIPIVGVPKTIDNDLEGTLWTFGFDSAVACATDALDRLHTTAESHRRVMVLEVMGRYAGWIALFAGVAGGADVILIPEMPFNYGSICGKIQEREDAGKHFTIVVVAEGAREQGGDFVTAANAPANREARLGGIGAVVAQEIETRSGKETRVCVLGHLQRGGSPTSFDRALCSVFGATRWSSSRPEISARWSPFWAPRSRASRSATRSASSRPSAPTEVWPAPLGRSASASAIERRRLTRTILAQI